MSGVHHTKVYGGLGNCRPWLSECVKIGFIPDILFTLGRCYVVATSPQGELYIRRGPKGPLETSRDPSLFNRRLHRQAVKGLRRHMSNLSVRVRTVSWSPALITEDTEKTACPVS